MEVKDKIIKLTGRDDVRVKGYKKIINATQGKHLMIKEIAKLVKSLSIPTTMVYCRYLADKGYLEEVKMTSGYKSVLYKAIKESYDMEDYEPMVLKNKSGVIQAAYEEEVITPDIGGRIISFNKDADLQEKYIELQRKYQKERTTPKNYASGSWAGIMSA